MKIGFISKKSEYAHSTPVMEQVYEILRKAGTVVETIIPESDLIDLSILEVNFDLYILRPGIELGLSIAGILHRKGARILNDYLACSVVQDKAQVSHDLIVNGIPTARSFITGSLSRVKRHLDGNAIIVKPHRGSYGEGIRILDTRDINANDAQRGGFFVQQYKKPHLDDLKVYVIGDKVMGLRRKFPATTFEEKLGKPTVVESHIRALALKIGTIFNLQIYGLDVIDTDDGPMVIDVNFFPGFVGVPNAPALLADYIYRYAVDNDTVLTAVN